MNKPQPNTAQNQGNDTQADTQKTPPKKLNIDFSHRHLTFGNGEATPRNLSEIVENAYCQAFNSINMVQMFFLGNEELETPSDDLIYWTLESANNCLRDMRAAVDAYYDATLSGEADSLEENRRQ